MKTERFALRMTPELRMRLQAAADAKGVNVTDLVEQFIEEGLDLLSVNAAIGMTSAYEEILKAAGTYKSQGWIILFRDADNALRFVTGHLSEVVDGYTAAPLTTLTVHTYDGRNIAIPRVRLEGWRYVGNEPQAFHTAPFAAFGATPFSK